MASKRYQRASGAVESKEWLWVARRMRLAARHAAARLVLPPVTRGSAGSPAAFLVLLSSHRQAQLQAQGAVHQEEGEDGAAKVGVQAAGVGVVLRPWGARARVRQVGACKGAWGRAEQWLLHRVGGGDGHGRRGAHVAAGGNRTKGTSATGGCSGTQKAPAAIFFPLND